MKNILVPLDFSDVTDRVIRTAKSLARDLGGKVFLLHVLPPSIIMTAYGITEDQIPEALHREQEKARRDIQTYHDQLVAENIETEVIIVKGPPVESILLVTREKKTDLLVMGSHGHGAFYEFVVGSTTRGVLKKFPGPVVLVPSRLPASEST